MTTHFLTISIKQAKWKVRLQTQANEESLYCMWHVFAILGNDPRKYCLTQELVLSKTLTNTSPDMCCWAENFNFGSTLLFFKGFYHFIMKGFFYPPKMAAFYVFSNNNGTLPLISAFLLLNAWCQLRRFVVYLLCCILLWCFMLTLPNAFLTRCLNGSSALSTM